jgi:hypothetical protein
MDQISPLLADNAPDVTTLKELLCQDSTFLPHPAAPLKGEAFYLLSPGGRN